MDLSSIAIDMSPILGFVVTVVAALALLIPARKAIKTVNRS